MSDIFFVDKATKDTRNSQHRFIIPFCKTNSLPSQIKITLHYIIFRMFIIYPSEWYWLHKGDIQKLQN